MNWNLQQYPQYNFDEADYLRTHLEKFRMLEDMILSRQKPLKILDIGAGTGTIYSLFPSLEGIEIHAIEIIPEFIATLQERGIQTCQFDLDKGEQLPFPDQTFDIVLCDSIIEHTLKPLHMLTESRRVLKMNGNLFLVVPNATSVRRRWDHFRGRNLFYPLIDNLFNRNYLQRCSIFYSEHDMRKFLGTIFSVDNLSFIDEKSHDETSSSLSIFRIISSWIPRLRDVLVVVGSKK